MQIKYPSVSDTLVEDTTCSEDERNIPLLSTVLSQLPRRIPLHVDVCGKFCCKVTKLLKDSGRLEDYVILGSTEFILCGECRRDVNNFILCKIKTFFNLMNVNTKAPNQFMGLRKVFLLMIYFLTGFLPYLHINETHYSIWLPSAVYKLDFICMYG